MPVGGGEEQRVTDALHKGCWGHFAVTDAGLYLLDSDAAPKPTIMFYSVQTRLLTPVLQLHNPVPWVENLAASRDGRTVSLPRGTGIAPSRWRRTSNRQLSELAVSSRRVAPG